MFVVLSRPALPSIATCIIAALVLGTSGLAAQKPVRIEVAHGQLSKTNVATARLGQSRDIWVVITDANPLIYTYSTTATQLVEDRQARADFERLLVARPAAPTRAGGGGGGKDTSRVAPGGTGKPTPEELFQQYALSILQLADTLRGRILATDLPNGSAGRTTIAEARESVGKATRDLGLDVVVNDTSLVLGKLRQLYGALTGDATAANEPLYQAAIAAAPGVVRWRQELLRVTDGPIEVLYEYPGTGDYLVSLSIANRLGESYQAHRYTGVGADIAVARPRFPTFQVSFGMGGLIGRRAEAELVKISATTSTIDTFELRFDTLKRLALLPSTYFSAQQGIGSTPWTVGGTIGVGLRGDELEHVGQSTDLMGLLSLGYDWLRLSVGRAYTSEVTKFNGTFRGAGADSTRVFTTDPNTLQHADRTRAWRTVVALHMTR